MGPGDAGVAGTIEGGRGGRNAGRAGGLGAECAAARAPGGAIVIFDEAAEGFVAFHAEMWAALERRQARRAG